MRSTLHDRRWATLLPLPQGRKANEGYMYNQLNMLVYKKRTETIQQHGFDTKTRVW